MKDIGVIIEFKILFVVIALTSALSESEFNEKELFSGYETEKLENKNLLSINQNISMLILENNTIKTIEPLTFTTFHRLKMLTIRKNNLTKLELGAFDGLSQLKILFINEERKLKTLDVNLLKKLKKLTLLDLSSNGFTNIEHGLFNDNTELQFLNLSQNNLTLLEPGIFEKLGSVDSEENLTTHLEIEGNQISIIRRNTFNGSQLAILNLRRNNISEIEPGAFSGLILRRLFLDNNKLTSIRAGTFDGILYINELDLSQNFINEIEDKSFLQLKSIQNIYIVSKGNEPYIDGRAWGLPKSSVVVSDHFTGYCENYTMKISEIALHLSSIS